MPSLDWYDCPIVIPYYGGKYELSKTLVPLIPTHERYIEVFAGGLSMFFRKSKAKWNVLNDIDNNIVNLYICVMYERDKLVKNLFWIPKSRKLFLDFREEIKENKEIEIPDPKQAAKYFYCIRNSFNKLIHTPFSMNKDMNKNWDEEFEYSRMFLGGATIENLDFGTLFDKYYPKEDDFWYLDPPYIIATEKGSYYMNNFTIEDHTRLRDCVNKIDEANGKFMVSYDYRPEVKELYKEYNVQTLNMRYTGATKDARKTERKEYIITNYEPVSQVEMFKEKINEK
jgi:DNA adenine methylase